MEARRVWGALDETLFDHHALTGCEEFIDREVGEFGFGDGIRIVLIGVRCCARRIGHVGVGCIEVRGPFTAVVGRTCGEGGWCEVWLCRIMRWELVVFRGGIICTESETGEGFVGGWRELHVGRVERGTVLFRLRRDFETNFFGRFFGSSVGIDHIELGGGSFGNASHGWIGGNGIGGEFDIRLEIAIGETFLLESFFGDIASDVGEGSPANEDEEGNDAEGDESATPAAEEGARFSGFGESGFGDSLIAWSNDGLMVWLGRR